jgi:hypothetical protein
MQRRLTTRQLTAVNDRARRSAGLCVARGLPAPTFLGDNLMERLDPAGEHLACYARGTDVGRGHEVTVEDYLGPGGCARVKTGDRFRCTHLFVKLLGVAEAYETRLDMTQEDFDSLPPADVRFTTPPPVCTPDDDFVGRKPKPTNGKNGPEDYDEEQHKGHMGRYVESVEQHTAQCCSCGREYTMDSITVAQFLDELYKDGWRLAASEHLETKGLMCDGCYRGRDQERGG